VRRERSAAFAPGRVNLIGEHTDYNDGLALPFAIAEGITVAAERIDEAPAEGLRPAGADAEHAGSPRPPGVARESARIEAHALDLDERDSFALHDPPRAEGWRAFVRGIVAELSGAGVELVDARLQISGGLPPGAGLSSSAALEVALCLALLDLAGGPAIERRELARLCSRVENDWVGAQTGLLDQLASLYGEPDSALCIDFSTLAIEPVALRLGGWRLAVLDSGEPHVHASSGYNERRGECARACELLGVRSLRELSADGSAESVSDAGSEAVARLPEPLRRRARHVISENRRVREAVAALAAEDLPALGALLSASHASLRDDYELSTPAVEATVRRMLDAGAAGARIHGGGFGGGVLGLFAPELELPSGAREVRPGAGAHLLGEG
jgi:galactokinase